MPIQQSHCHQNEAGKREKYITVDERLANWPWTHMMHCEINDVYIINNITADAFSSDYVQLETIILDWTSYTILPLFRKNTSPKYWSPGSSLCTSYLAHNTHTGALPLACKCDIAFSRKFFTSFCRVIESHIFEEELFLRLSVINPYFFSKIFT